ncbi:MAG: Uma2 family endonuclease [Thiothrix sp.]|nr:MAG: Uma2 family endonuclease [Thiothrix sp.]
MAHAIQYQYTDFAEYLAAERETTARHEYVDGEIYAMSGASELHNVVNAELFASIYAQLPDECRAFMSDMKLKVEYDNKIFAYYPDIMVACGANTGDPYVRTNPLLLVEVLSPSTKRTDLTEKLVNYSAIPSLLEYLVVHQDTPHVQLYRRRTAWQVEHFFASDELSLESIKLTMPVTKIYRKVRPEVGLLD